MYKEGYVFTRLGKGVLDQTRSVRIDLSKFELSSENRRVLRKTEDLSLKISPIPYKSYSWEIGKMAKDFYESRDADFSANKTKELLTDVVKSNFTDVFIFTETKNSPEGTPVGYCITYSNTTMMHYSYPFYSLGADKDTGLGMMLRAITFAKDSGMKYIYLGSLQRPSDTYKLQFSGLEWFDGKTWNTSADEAKLVLKNI